MGDMVLGLCHHLQGPTQNPEQVGEQGVCGGVAALSKPTSVCGMSPRWEGHAAIPYIKISVTHQP